MRACRTSTGLAAARGSGPAVWRVPRVPYLRLLGGDRRLAPLVRGDDVAVQEPAPAVCAHVHDQGDESPPYLGQPVLDPRRYLRVRAALDDAVVLERPQPQRERPGADSLERSLQLAEALASVGQVADHEERPLAGDDLRATSNWTRILSHLGGRWARPLHTPSPRRV